MTHKSIGINEPRMLHHNFDQDPEDPHLLIWSEVYKNDTAYLLN